MTPLWPREEDLGSLGSKAWFMSGQNQLPLIVDSIYHAFWAWPCSVQECKGKSKRSVEDEMSSAALQGVVRSNRISKESECLSSLTHTWKWCRELYPCWFLQSPVSQHSLCICSLVNGVLAASVMNSCLCRDERWTCLINQILFLYCHKVEPFT